MKLRLLQACSFVGAMTSSSALAFCGFYVAGADTQLFNEATTVVMMRHGTTTVLSMQNDYKGPPEDFAMVVPVPEVLEEDNVRTLPHHVFARIDQMAAPRLVEYWEQNPCSQPSRRSNRGFALGALDTLAAGPSSSSAYRPPPPVRIEAEFSVEEYDIVILSADDSTSLEAWLEHNGYNIPEGAGAALRPYVEQDMKFFVAKVDTDKVRWEGTGQDRHAVLSPLRMHYQSDSFSLPVRLGMLNSSGTQDLIVHVLAEEQRYEVANLPNVTIPTNVVVEDATRSRFGAFYAALFDRTIAETGAVVTEYSWQASTCDPCPGPALTTEDLNAVGGDAVPFESVPPPPSNQWQSTLQVEHATLPVLLTSGNGDLTDVLSRCHASAYRGFRSDAVAGRVRVEVSESAEVGGARTLTVVANTLPAEPAAQRENFETCVVRAAVPPQVTPGTMDVMLSGAGRGSGGHRADRLRNFVLTRLHYRYDRDDLADDLVFRPAPPIAGGRGVPRGSDSPELGMPPGVHEGSVNNFQGRYAILHEWSGAVECPTPRRGNWGGPTRDVGRPAVMAARNLGHVARGGIQLDRFVAAATLPTIMPTPDVTVGYGIVEARDMTLPPLPGEAITPETPAAESGGCGCSPAAGSGALLPVLLWLVLRRRD